MRDWWRGNQEYKDEYDNDIISPTEQLKNYLSLYRRMSKVDVT